MEDLWALGHADDSFGGSVLGSKGTQWLWFSDRDEVLDYLLGDYVDLLADTGELDDEQLESARDRFTDLVESCSNDEQLVRELNELSVELRRIIWFGSLSELATGYRDFAMALRHYYWQQLGEEDEPDAPVPTEQWGELVEMLDDFLIDGEYR